MNRQKIISVANEKGGTGKTTTAVNLAAVFSCFGNHVLLIDSDQQMNATSSLGYKDWGGKSYSDLLNGDIPIKDCIMMTPYCDLIPASHHLGVSEKNRAATGNHFCLADALETVPEYDFVIIDCPPRMDSLVRNAFVAASDVIVPIDTGSYSLDGLMQVNATIGMIKRHENPKLRISGLLKVMFDDRTLLSNEMDEALNTIAKKMETQVYGTSIHRSIQVDVASHNHMPLFFYKPKCKVAMDYYDLGMEVAYHVNN